jgi:hypothetical protein
MNPNRNTEPKASRNQQKNNKAVSEQNDVEANKIPWIE